ncbi:sigma-E factor negative regulatory protein [Alcaligenes aquatilis]|uniref:sigma-E factor negative regulatory protein n=1 Tax=Alcaligenes aquatilis TaxID=323284 RepID=UPI00355F7B5D
MQALKSHSDEDQLNAWEAAVSSWVDGEAEIRPEELDSPYGRQVWDTYHLIGDVMRTDALAIRTSDRFYARLSKAIDEEPTVLAPSAMKRPLVQRYGVSGLAVVAAVAAALWVGLPYMGVTSVPGTLVASAQDDQLWSDYADLHRDFVGAGPVRHVSFESGALGQ